ncbi:hypothetical protein HDU89_008636 [Geranomyces variabilis]|nr:hypothetical protein HDU89_008636 [Geranomyces variabilis]
MHQFAASEAGSWETGHIMRHLSWLDRLLPLWIISAMVLGVLLGNYVPSVGTILGSTTIAEVSLPIAIGLLWMMYPVFCKVRYEQLGSLFRSKQAGRNIVFSLIANWIVAPLLMAALAWAALPDLPSYRVGILLVGVARCIAMVLIWNDLAGGDPEWCAVLVAVNSILQVLLFSPLAYFYAVVIGKGTGLNINMWLAGFMTRLILRNMTRKMIGPEWYDQKFLRFIAPTSLLGLLFTIIVMFALQGQSIVEQIGEVMRVCVPLVLYFCIAFSACFTACGYFRTPYALAVTQSFTAASNNFELAIAVAVATYGIESQEALATVIGPLVEVPVLLGLVYLSLYLRRFYPEVDARNGNASCARDEGASLP